MAARLNARHDDEARKKIQTSQLINRLEDHILNDKDLKPSQVQAALGLLKKTLPDLANLDVGSDPDRPVKMLLGWMTEQQGS